jgi:hypothetical protein
MNLTPKGSASISSASMISKREIEENTSKKGFPV